MKHVIISIIWLSVCYSLGCRSIGNENSVKDSVQQIETLKIVLAPAFNHTSHILINNENQTIEFKVDKIKEYRKQVPGDYVANLDSFEKYTLIDSFYSASFLDSIKYNPKYSIWTDGLAVTTIIGTKNHSDTIISGNHYSVLLSENLTSQLNYISNNTKDTVLKKYIEDLIGYFQ